jgi:hypothetical protein
VGLARSVLWLVFGLLRPVLRHAWLRQHQKSRISPALIAKSRATQYAILAPSPEQIDRSCHHEDFLLFSPLLGTLGVQWYSSATMLHSFGGCARSYVSSYSSHKAGHASNDASNDASASRHDAPRHAPSHASAANSVDPAQPGSLITVRLLPEAPPA